MQMSESFSLVTKLVDEAFQWDPASNAVLSLGRVKL